jgi:WD40 repeat protein
MTSLRELKCFNNNTLGLSLSSSGEFIRIYSHPAAIYCVDPSPVSPHIFAAGTEDGSVFIVDSRLPSSE